MIQDKNTPELPGHIPIRTSGIFPTLHLPGFMGRWGAWIVLLASLLITFNAWYFVRGEATKRAQARFDFRVKTIETGIYERLQAYEFLLRGGSSLFATSDEVTREDWQTYVTKLQINQYYPGIQGVGFSKHILPSEKEAHLSQIRSEGFPQYTIKPEGDRPEYTSIIFLEPFDWRNQRAFGYDMFSEPTRKEAMVRARDTGIAALSGKVTLVQETAKDIQAGFLIYLAIYRKGEPLENPEQRREALMGYVYSPFRMNEFMKGILVEKEGYVNLQIFDGEKPLKETLLYRSDTTEEIHNAPEDSHFATNQSILEYAGRRWLLSFISSKYFEENIETGSMNFILLLGITISLLLFGMVLSLTRSRSQAIALKESELLFSQMFEQSTTSTCFYNPKGTIVKVNQAFCKMFGVEENTIFDLGYNVFKDQNVINGEVIPLLRDIFDEKKTKNWEINFNIGVASDSTGTPTSKTGKIFLEIFGYPVLNHKGNLEYVVLQHYDITSRKKAEEELLNEKNFSEAIIESIPGMLYVYDDQGTHILHNKKHEEMTGYSADELSHLNPLSWYDDKADILRVEAAINDVFTKGYGEGEVPMRIKNGKKLMMHFTGSRLVMNGNKYFVGVGTDITDRKQAEEALKKSEVRYRSMMESITDQLYICSPDFTVEYMNPAMISRLGRNATGERCHNALHGLDYRCDWCVFNKVAKGESIETTIIGPLDGRTYRVTNMPVQNQNGTVSKMSIFRDITGYLKAVAEKEKLEQELRQAQKMESIGTLAGGIAHDFNNILYPIMGFAELSLEDLPENHPVKENLKDILQGAKRARDLVKQILAFSSQREEEQKPLVLSPLIQETLKLLRSTIPSNIDIQKELYDTQDCVLVSPIEIHEIVMNLCTNAYHAMEETGGTIRICLYKSEPDPKLNLSHGDYCCLSIHDTGIGIPTEIINNIFDPYFTTKEQGKGSGLGLSVVHGIIKKAHGAISVESIPGKGTVFKIYLPITSAINKPDETSEDKPSLGGNEKILFVDDEVAIVKLGVRLLEKLGYTVTGKNSSIEALALFKSAPDAFNLVITDMTMPQMVGTEFAAKLMETRPDIPIIICTGFSERVDIETAVSLGIREYIHKPILSVDLYSKVRAVLDQTKKDKNGKNTHNR